MRWDAVLVNDRLMVVQVKEEFENDPDFLQNVAAAAAAAKPVA